MPVIESEKPVEKEKEENDLKNNKEFQDRIRARREALQRKRNNTTVKPITESMSKKEIEEWSKANLTTPIDYSGAGLEAARVTTNCIYAIESKGIDLGGMKVRFGGLGANNYGLYNRNTNELILRSNSSYLAQVEKLNEKTIRKWGIPYNAVTSYEGTVYHELGHALDDKMGHLFVNKIASNNELFNEAIKVSYYAADKPFDIRASKATETFAECFSAYMCGGEAAKRVPKEVAEMIEKYLFNK